MIVAISQGKALGVLLRISAQIADLADPMHGQRCLVGPVDGLVELQQNHPVGQPGDDLLQLTAVGIGGRDVLVHWLSTGRHCVKMSTAAVVDSATKR
ncbi:hypothetical protein D3C73_1076140 [compost metagenome]